jgi:hypothetical protein
MKKIQLILILLIAMSGTQTFSQTLDVEWGGVKN